MVLLKVANDLAYDLVALIVRCKRSLANQQRSGFEVL